MSNAEILSQVVSIGNLFAGKLGYEHLVGVNAVVTSKMSHTATVMILVGEHVGQEETIHIEDCLVAAQEYGALNDVIVDYKNKEILYSPDKDLVDYVMSVFSFLGAARIREVPEIHLILDDILERQAKGMLEPGDWKIISIENPPENRDTFIKSYNLNKRYQEAFNTLTEQNVKVSEAVNGYKKDFGSLLKPIAPPEPPKGPKE